MTGSKSENKKMSKNLLIPIDKYKLEFFWDNEILVIQNKQKPKIFKRFIEIKNNDNM